MVFRSCIQDSPTEEAQCYSQFKENIMLIEVEIEDKIKEVLSKLS